MRTADSKISILLVDDLVLFRQGLGVLLANEDAIRLAGEAADGYEAFRLVSELKPDVVVTDIQMPDMNGIELTKELKQTFPGLPVIAHTQFKEDHLIADMMEAGAKGYLLKSANKENVVEAIRAVHAGGWYFCNSTSLKLVKLIAGGKIEGLPLPEATLFSPAEIKIIQLICREFSSKEIATEVHLGERTVENYRHRIFEKMGVRNMAGMAIYAIRCGIFKP